MEEENSKKYDRPTFLYLKVGKHASPGVLILSTELHLINGSIHWNLNIAAQMLKMKVLGSVVFVLFYMVLVRKQGPHKKTIEKPKEKLKHKTSPAPL